MASVPRHYIKFKDIDFEGEIFSCLNLPRTIAGFTFTPPSLGVFALLEVIDSKIVSDFKGATLMDLFRAAHICIHRKQCASAVRDWHTGKGSERFNGIMAEWHQWDRDVLEYFKNANFKLSDMVDFHDYLMGTTFDGYEMIPDSGASEYKPFLFGAESISAVLRNMQGLGFSYDEIMWDVPLCMVGFISASNCIEKGAKGVARPKDKEDIKLQLKLANERELKGELHLWQIREPQFYRPSEVQKKANPDIARLHNLELKRFIREQKEKANK